MAAPQAWAYHTLLLLHLCQQTHTEGQVGFIDALLTYVCRDVHLLFAHRDPAWALFKTAAGAGVSAGSVKLEHEQQPLILPLLHLHSFTGHFLSDNRSKANIWKMTMMSQDL